MLSRSIPACSRRQNGRIHSINLLVGLLMLQIVLALVAWGVGAWSLGKSPAALLQANERLLESWQSINIQAGATAPKLVLARQAGKWVFPEFDQLLVDAFRLRQTLQALAEPERLTLLGESEAVQARFATTPSHHRVQWTLANADGQSTTLYWGERVSSQSMAVRRADSPKVYALLMSSAPEADRWESFAHQVRGWVDANQFNVPGGRSRLTRIEGDDFTLVRPPQSLSKLNTPSAALILSTDNQAASTNINLQTLSAWQWLDQPKAPLNQDKVAALSEALGELLIANVLPSSTAQTLRRTAPLSTISFDYQKAPTANPSSTATAPPSSETSRRRYQLYAYGNDVAIDFGGSTLVVPASEDGDKLRRAHRSDLEK